MRFLLPLALLLSIGCTPKERPESVEIKEFEVIGVDSRLHRYGLSVDLLSTDHQNLIARDVYIGNACFVEIGSRWKFYLLTFKDGSMKVETIGDLCVTMKK